MRIGLTQKIWNAEIREAMVRKGFNSVQDLAVAIRRANYKRGNKESEVAFKSLIGLRDTIYKLCNLHARMAKDPERRSLLEKRLLALCTILEIDLDSAMPEWFLEMPLFPTKIETVRNFDRLALMGQLERVQALPAPRDIEKEEAVEILHETLDFLTGREREILKLRFGLGGGPRYTSDEVGRMFHLTKEYIRTLEAKAVNKIKKVLESKVIDSGKASAFREAVEAIVPHLYSPERVG